MTSKWKNDEFLSQPRSGLKLQQRVSYYEINGRMYKETISRRYYGDGDYQDSHDIQPL